MKFTVAALIDQLPAEEQLSVSKLEKALGLSTKADKEQLRIALTALVRVGVLRESGDGVGRLEDEGLIEARLRCSSKGFCFALRDDGGEDIYVRSARAAASSSLANSPALLRQWGISVDALTRWSRRR